MPRRIAIIQGHPDPSGQHLGHALAEAYIGAASAAGHEIRLIEVAKIEFPVLRTQRDWESGALPNSLNDAQAIIGWAQHLVIFFPLWLGTMPAMLHAFFEQLLRPGFAFDKVEPGRPSKTRLRGKSARLVVTMGMPAPIYRWYFLAHGVRGMERNALAFCGIRPIKETFIGAVEGNEQVNQIKWLPKMAQLGRAGT